MVNKIKIYFKNYISKKKAKQELVKVYFTNNALWESNKRLQNIAIDIAKRNNDTEGMKNISIILEDFVKKLKFKN